MNKKSTAWWARYLLVIVVTLVLGAALGELSFFQKTSLGTRLNAANLVRFLGYGSALALLWLLAQRAAQELKRMGGWQAQACHFVLPLATVVIVPASQPVLLLVLGGLLGPDLRKIYDWLFILGTLGSAVWLVLSLYQHLEPLLESLRAASNPPAAE